MATMTTPISDVREEAAAVEQAARVATDPRQIQALQRAQERLIHVAEACELLLALLEEGNPLHADDVAGLTRVHERLCNPNDDGGPRFQFFEEGGES